MVSRWGPPIWSRGGDFTLPAAPNKDELARWSPCRHGSVRSQRLRPSSALDPAWHRDDEPRAGRVITQFVQMQSELERDLGYLVGAGNGDTAPAHRVRPAGAL